QHRVGVVRHFDAESFRQADHVAEIASRLGRIDVDPPDDLEPWTGRNLLDDGGTDRPQPEVDHPDVRHSRELYSSSMFGKRGGDARQKPVAAATTVHPGGLTRDHVVWAYRLLLDRDPENEDVIAPKLAGSRDTRELRHHLMTSGEFREKNPDYAHANDRTIVIKELDGPDGPVRLFVDLADHVI